MLVSSTKSAILALLIVGPASAFLPLIDGGKGMPKLYDGWFNQQICKQASTAVSKAIGAGKVSHILFNCGLTRY